MDTIKRWMKNGASFLEDSILLSSLRQGVVLAIPFLMAGSIALVLNSFPVSGYQAFLDGFLGEGSGTCSSDLQLHLERPVPAAARDDQL